MTGGAPRRVSWWDRLMSRGDLGRLGERLARRHMHRAGYAIRATNLRLPRSEIDILAEQGEVLVIVEVRTRRIGSPIRPEATVDAKKQQQLARAVDELLVHSPLARQRFIRFDIVAIVIDDRWRLHQFDHIERAFDPDRTGRSRR